MKRVAWIGLIAVFLLWARGAAADEPREIMPTGNVAADAAIAYVNLVNRAMKMMEDEGNLHLKAAEYYRQLMEMEQRLQQERKRLTELDRQLATQEGDLLANLKSQKVGKSEAEIAALEAEYERRREELAKARRQVNGLPAMVQEVGKHIGDQARLLKRVRTMADWVDPRTGRGKLRAIFQKRRYKIAAITDRIATTSATVKAVIDKGSTLDVTVERVGAFTGTVAALSAGPPAFEWTINGVRAGKGATVAIGDDRTLRIQVKLLDERRKQSRAVMAGAYTHKKVTTADYDYEYGIDDRTYSRWVIAEEEYEGWLIEARTARVPGKKLSTSGVHAKVKGDLVTITFSPDTAAETFHVSVIGRTRWEMTGLRNGKAVTDSAEASGSGSIDVQVAPSR